MQCAAIITAHLRRGGEAEEKGGFLVGSWEKILGYPASDNQERSYLTNKTDGENQHSRLLPDLHIHATEHTHSHT